MDNQKFGRFIRDLRKKANMTQKELGEKLHVTDKAVSKWERGLGFPDITIINLLAETFGITASEVLNAEIGKKETVDVEKAVQEAVEKVTKEREKKENRKRKIIKIVKVVSIIIFVLMILLQLGYLCIMKPNGYEYINDLIFYIVNELIMVTGVVFLILQIKKLKSVKIVAIIIAVILSVINLAFMINNAINMKTIFSFSNDFSNELVIKQNKENGETRLYKYAKLILFAKPDDLFEYSVSENIKHQWLTNDICNITFMDRDGNLRNYVATYGSRKGTNSYYYVFNALLGRWQTQADSVGNTRLTVDSKGIKVTRDDTAEQFEVSDCKQYGVTALVLYKEDIPKYVIALNDDCEIDEDTTYIKNGGTITFCDISMKKTIKETLYCTVYKDENLNNYNGITVEANNFKIDNGILYFSYDGENIIEVPGDFSDDKSAYNEHNYTISEEKTVFFYTKDETKYLVFSDDMGNTWNTTNLPSNGTIQNIQFLNKDVGFILQFEDYALGGVTFGHIAKTTDGGQTWTIINNGIGSSNEGTFRSGSQLLFVNENIAFVTMPYASGDDSALYYSEDGGINFTKVTLSDEQIYDYYQLPTIEDGKLYLEVGQGNDGDYNGGDYKKYCSEDNGKTWTEM